MTDRPYTDGSKPGRVDIHGKEWYACDPYPTWFRWEDDQGNISMDKGRKLQVMHWPNRFADEPEEKPCGRTCRLISFSDYCQCQGWCL